MKTQGEIEAAVCRVMSQFQQDFVGRGSKEIRSHLIDDLVAVRLRGVLTEAEQHLVKTLPHEKGRDRLKQVRTHLLESTRPRVARIIQEATGAKMVSLHHDISTVTGDEIVLVTLAEAPHFRETNRK